MQVNTTTIAAMDGDGFATLAPNQIDATLHLLRDEFRQACTSSTDETGLLRQMALAIQQRGRVNAIFFCRQVADGTQQLQRLDRDETTSPPTNDLIKQCCRDAGGQGLAHLGALPGGGWVVSLPMLANEGSSEFLIALTQTESSGHASRVAEMLQLAAAQLVIWRSETQSQRLRDEARCSAALLDASQHVVSAKDLRHGCLSLANALQTFLDCDRVAIGVSRSAKSKCRLQAISGFSTFDKRSEAATQMEAAMQEAILFGDLILWPDSDADAERTPERIPAQAQRRAAEAMQAKAIISAPLYDHEQNPVGVCTLVNPSVDREATRQFLAAAQTPLGLSLQVLQRASGGRVTQTLRAIARAASKRRLMVVAVGIALVIAALAWPRPHKIACDCRLQPSVRRFVSAPFDGTLRKCLVKPGDLVEKGEILAEMDGRDIRLKLAALKAEFSQARKSREVALAAEDYHQAQQAKLEMQRLQLNIRLAEDHRNNLRIKSPIRGFVISGDLETSEGESMTVGRPLVEVAPAARMIVDVVVPERDIAYAKSGMEVNIRLNPFPWRTIPARITRIVPRAELRDDRFVFIAKAEIENQDEQFRPGMNGRAILIGERRSNAWLLFHRPLEALLMRLGW